MTTLKEIQDRAKGLLTEPDGTGTLSPAAREMIDNAPADVISLLAIIDELIGDRERARRVAVELEGELAHITEADDA